MDDLPTEGILDVPVEFARIYQIAAHADEKCICHGPSLPNPRPQVNGLGSHALLG